MGERGFQDMEEDVLELVHSNNLELTEQELVKLVQSAHEEEEEGGSKSNGEPQQEGLTLGTLVDIMRFGSSLKSAMYGHDFSSFRALKCETFVDQALAPNKVMLKEL